MAKETINQKKAYMVLRKDFAKFTHELKQKATKTDWDKQRNIISLKEGIKRGNVTDAELKKHRDESYKSLNSIK